MGLAEVHQDELGNVFGIRPGTDSDAPYFALSAHLDTVFPAGTAITVSRDGGKLYGPGISDNASGIIALLAIAGALRAAEIANSRPSCSSAMWARRAKATCAACVTSSSSRAGPIRSPR